MLQPSLRSLTSPTTLALFDEGLLYHLLSPHRAYLAEHGFDLGDSPGGAAASGLDLRALSHALLADDTGFPHDLADGLATIIEVGHDHQVAAMEWAAERAGVELGSTPGDTPIDVATRLWLARPDLLRRIHAEAQVPAARRYEVWRCTEAEVPELALPDDPDLILAAWAAELDRYLAQRHFGGGTRIYLHRTERLCYFLIHHGATLTRVPTHQEDGSATSVVFRPAMTDVLRYDPQHGELGVYLQRHRKWLSEAMRTTFSLRLFAKPHLFCGERRVSLDPLLNGSSAIDPIAYPEIASVRLTEVEFTHDAATAGKVIYRAVDVYDLLDLLGISLVDQNPPTAAKLKIELSDGATRSVTIRWPNVAVYQRLGDDDVIGRFLAQQGFTAVVDSDALDQVA